MQQHIANIFKQVKWASMCYTADNFAVSRAFMQINGNMRYNATQKYSCDSAPSQTKQKSIALLFFMDILSAKVTSSRARTKNKITNNDKQIN